MRSRGFAVRSVVILTVASLLLPVAPAVRANDLVPSEDITGGASVFVFRGSKKRPQGAFRFRKVFPAEGSSRRRGRPPRARANPDRRQPQKTLGKGPCGRYCPPAGTAAFGKDQAVQRIDRTRTLAP